MFKFKKKVAKQPSPTRPVIAKTSHNPNKTTIDTDTLEKFEMPHKASNSASGSTLLALATLAVITVAGLLVGISSLWKVLNPEISFTLPNMSVLRAIASDTDLPNYLPPTFEDFSTPLTEEELAEKFDEFRENGSELLNKIPDVELAEQYQAICTEIQAGTDSQAIADSIARSFILSIPGLENQNELAQELVSGALTLCPVPEETP